MKDLISITAIASISPLGFSEDEVWANYQNDKHLFKRKTFNGASEWIAPLSDAAREEIDWLKHSDSKYRNLDDSVLFALYASRKAVTQAGWSKDLGSDNPASERIPFGVNIGSSRGATSLFEKYHEEFLRDKRAATLSSPTTTLGNISSWVAHDLRTPGPEISHSITCSTALHALLNGVAWIKSGMTDRFLVGGSEAPLTPFTIAQMKALKIYAKYMPKAIPRDFERYEKASNTKIKNFETSSENNTADKIIRADTGKDRRHDSLEYPCQALNFNKKQNTMILGEGAAVACLEKGLPPNALAVIEGVGYATEPLRHNTSISTDAQCFQRSMQMALGETASEEVDVIVMHAPGTVKGDASEYRAIQKIFGESPPVLITNKWKIGHTFGTSGMLSVELALLMLEHQKFVEVPFVKYANLPKKIGRVMVNAVGFGGNAVSILLKIPPKIPV